MSYYDTIEEDLRRAEEILAARSLALRQGAGTSVPYADTAYQLLESFVAAIEELRLNEKMLAAVFRHTVVALADVPDDWTGTVKEGRELINANARRASDQVESYQLLLAVMGVTDYKAAVLAWKARLDEIERLHVEHTRAVLRYTVKGYQAGENADATHWRRRAEEAEADSSELRAEIARLRGQLLVETAETERLQAEVEDLHEDVANADDATVAAQEKILVLREQLIEAERALDRALGQ